MNKAFKYTHKIISIFLTAALIFPPHPMQAQEIALPMMPTPGSRVTLSPIYTPAYLQGITIHPDNALKFDFYVHQADVHLNLGQKNQEYKKLVKYFLASLTIPDKDQWVNLSPYEHERTIPHDLGLTEMGRDLLAQDYILKQISSSLMYPESDLGKTFWDKVYAEAFKRFGNTNIPVNTFNKVWIVPDQAVVYEHNNTAYVLKSHLKVMLEEDYLSLKKHSDFAVDQTAMHSFGTHAITSKVIKEIILPALEKEVNEGKNFAPLRQIVSAMILAVWYKKTLKESLLGQNYTDKAKVAGVEQKDQRANEVIYQTYLKAFKKGAYNYIKEDFDKYTKQEVPRKYFAGGFHAMDVAALSVVDDSTHIGPLIEALKDSALAGRMDQIGVVLGEAGDGKGIDRTVQALQDDVENIFKGGKIFSIKGGSALTFRIPGLSESEAVRSEMANLNLWVASHMKSHIRFAIQEGPRGDNLVVNTDVPSDKMRSDFAMTVSSWEDFKKNIQWREILILAALASAPGIAGLGQMMLGVHKDIPFVNILSWYVFPFLAVYLTHTVNRLPSIIFKDSSAQPSLEVEKLPFIEQSSPSDEGHTPTVLAEDIVMTPLHVGLPSDAHPEGSSEVFKSNYEVLDLNRDAFVTPAEVLAAAVRQRAMYADNEARLSLIQEAQDSILKEIEFKPISRHDYFGSLEEPLFVEESSNHKNWYLQAYKYLPNEEETKEGFTPKLVIYLIAIEDGEAHVKASMVREYSPAVDGIIHYIMARIYREQYSAITAFLKDKNSSHLDNFVAMANEILNVPSEYDFQVNGAPRRIEDRDFERIQQLAKEFKTEISGVAEVLARSGVHPATVEVHMEDLVDWWKGLPAKIALKPGAMAANTFLKTLRQGFYLNPHPNIKDSSLYTGIDFPNKLQSRSFGEMIRFLDYVLNAKPGEIYEISIPTFSGEIKVLDPRPAFWNLSSTTPDQAMSATNGGIDLNSAQFNLQIKRDDSGKPLAFDKQGMAQLSDTEGFEPSIVEILTVTNLSL